jgi:hypothetical protein
LKNDPKPNYENFIFNHKNLITDFQQKKTKDWALKVAGHIWTKDEIEGHELEYSKNTTRPPLIELDSFRYNLFKG